MKNSRAHRWLRLIGLAVCAASTYAPLLAQTRAAIPAGVLDRLAAGQPQDLIVQFDDSSIQEWATRLQATEHVTTDNALVLSAKATGFAALKTKAFGMLPQGELEVLRDYSQLPMAFVRFHTSGSLVALASDATIQTLFEDGIEQPMQSVLPNLQQIDQPMAAAGGLIGTGTTVAVIDTGVDYTNPAFGSCTAPGDPFTCKVVTYQYICCNDGSLDPIGHGTNVAGIALEVAPDTRIAALRVFDASGNAADSNIIAAINWAISNKTVYNISAVNLSLGTANSNYPTPCTGSSYVSPFANARSAGILPAVAAGNSGFTTGIGLPACSPGAVSVGAVDSLDHVAYFSDSASYLSLFAPGVGIYAAGSVYSGTSQATPHVAGAAAVLRAEVPSDTVDQTVARMTTTGFPIQTPGGYSIPRLDLFDSSLPPPLTVGFYPLLSYPIGSGPYGLAVGQFNADTLSDIVTANSVGGTVSFLLTHAGGFLSHSDAPAQANPRGAVVGDLDNDGNLDVAVNNYGSSTVTVYLGHGNGTFSTLVQNNFPVGANPYQIASGDFNGDHAIDLVTSNFTGGTVSVLLGVGNGTFSPQVTYPVQNHPLGVAVGKFSSSGFQDIAVTNNTSNTVSVLLGNGNGTFRPQVPYPVGTNPFGIAIADIDGDGNQDLVVANQSSNTVSILFGNGDGTFQPAKSLPAGSLPEGIAIADMNGDGWPDIIVANYSSNNIGLFLGNSHHTFEPMQVFGSTAGPQYVAIADFNGDRHPDVAVTSYGTNSVGLLLNRTDYIFTSSFERIPKP